MAVDPTTIELAARLQRLNTRIERLETLEYSTVAFPGGGGLTVLCDVKLVAPAASVVCFFSPVGIPHVMAITAASVLQTGALGTVAGKIRVLINGIVGVAYEYSTRQEHRVFFDAQAVTLTGGADLETVKPSGNEIAIGPTPVRNSATYIFPTPLGSSGATIVSGAWIGAAMYRNQGFPDITNLQELDLGGGGNVLATGALTSLTFLTTAPELFDTGSRFTVYGL